MEDSALDRALQLLFVKGSEGDGHLHLTCEETHALCEYVRRLRRQPQPVNVTVEIDGREIARHVVADMHSTIRNASGKRNF